ncbi:MAG: IS1 family transposase [Polyangiaceae bacterium]
MNSLDTSRRVQVVRLLVEGMSVRATCRATGVAKGTVLKLLAELGEACAKFHHEKVRGVVAKRVQCDEIWSFCGAKDKNVLPDEAEFGRGSIWTWTAITESKLIVAYHVGTRDAACAYEFMSDLESRLASRVQLTTDGHKAYLSAVADTFGPSGVDYAMLVKLYGPAPEGPGRYSPAACIGAQLVPVHGKPDAEHVSTSYVERANLTMRMSMRRFTRLTNAFSKKIENHAAAIALHFMFYNFCRIHQTLRATPAMASGLADHVWEIEELLALMPAPTRAAWGSKKGKSAA